MSLVVARPDRRIPLPDPLDELGERACSSGYELRSLRGHALEELVERVGELLHALLLEHPGHVVVDHAAAASSSKSLRASSRPSSSVGRTSP